MEVLVEAVRIPPNVQVTPCEPVLVEFNLSGSADVHEVLQFAGRERLFERGPVRLADYGGNLNRIGHTICPLTAGGTPTCECLQPMQQVAAVILLIACSNREG